MPSMEKKLSIDESIRAWSLVFSACFEKSLIRLGVFAVYSPCMHQTMQKVGKNMFCEKFIPHIIHAEYQNLCTSELQIYMVTFH